ncbi:MAG: inositol monophosphatase family protein [Myxococcota bacterium]
MPPDIEALTNFAQRLADAARDETLSRFRTALAVEAKAATSFDPVTAADREAERAIRRLIDREHPEHGVLGEEFPPSRPDAALRWVLDPVDGTRSFICGVPTWTTLIALEAPPPAGEPLIGIIDQPCIGERWVGAAGQTRFRPRSGTAEPVTTSGCTRLEDAKVATTDPRPVGGPFTATEAEAFRRIAAAARLARFSMDAYAYALLASGMLDLVVEAGLGHHDYAALAPVVRGAGGVITNWKGGPFDAEAGGRVVAAATAELHEAALRLLS